MQIRILRFLWWILGTSKRVIYCHGSASGVLIMGIRGARLIGDHKKNSVAVQKDIGRFTRLADKADITTLLSLHVFLSLARSGHVFLRQIFEPV